MMRLGIDVGGTKIAAALVDPEGRLSGRILRKLDTSSDRSALEQLRAIIAHFSESGAPVSGIGVAVPGIADPAGRTVWAPNIPGWDHIPLWERLEGLSPAPLAIESDRNAAVLGEWIHGAARGKSDVVFLIIGTGIGAGVISGGRLVRGAHEIAGAVGWFPIEFRGASRHFEELAAGPAIEKRAAAAGHGVGLPQLAERAREGKAAELELLRETGEIIGRAVSILISSFDPELVVMGGGVGRIWDLIAEPVRSSAARWGQPIAAAKVEITASRLGEDAGILGAAAAAGPDPSRKEER